MSPQYRGVTSEAKLWLHISTIASASWPCRQSEHHNLFGAILMLSPAIDLTMYHHRITGLQFLLQASFQPATDAEGR